ncbi:MAG: hypothetical protein KDK27_18945 [Leptospiraceae bacterium]|nr:hypothetical protein [Leptospiraceae bacterium]
MTVNILYKSFFHEYRLSVAILLICAFAITCTKRYFGVQEGTPPDELVSVWRDWPIHIDEINGESGYPTMQLTKVPLYTMPGTIKIIAYYGEGSVRTNPITVTFEAQPGDVWLLCSEIQGNNWRPVITQDRGECSLLRFHEMRASVYGEPMEFDPEYKPID